jgi:hypothetical protein
MSGSTHLQFGFKEIIMWTLRDLIIICAGLGLICGLHFGCTQKNRPPVAIIKVTDSQGNIIK